MENIIQPSDSPSQQPSLSPTTSMAELQKLPLDRKSLTSARRASTISLSSLHRTPFPHKLDLSSIAFNPDDAIPLHSGQASPVTLAPKSSILRASMPPPDLLSVSGRAVDIDLTLDDDDVAMAMGNAGDPALGTSADKPIELDLDDLFTESSEHVSAVPSSSMGPGDGASAGDSRINDIFDVLQGSSNTDTDKPSGSMDGVSDFLMQPAESQENMFSGSSHTGEPNTTSTTASTLDLQFGDFTNLTNLDSNMPDLFGMNATNGFGGSSSTGAS